MVCVRVENAELFLVVDLGRHGKSLVHTTFYIDLSYRTVAVQRWNLVVSIHFGEEYRDLESIHDNDNNRR